MSFILSPGLETQGSNLPNYCLSNCCSLVMKLSGCTIHTIPYHPYGFHTSHTINSLFLWFFLIKLKWARSCSLECHLWLFMCWVGLAKRNRCTCTQLQQTAEAAFSLEPVLLKPPEAAHRTSDRVSQARCGKLVISPAWKNFKLGAKSWTSSLCSRKSENHKSWDLSASAMLNELVKSSF